MNEEIQEDPVHVLVFLKKEAELMGQIKIVERDKFSQIP